MSEQQNQSEAIKQLQEQLTNADSFGEIELDNPEITKRLLENPITTDYGYKGKRYFNVLNEEYQANQFRKRVIRDAINRTFTKKMEPKFIWISVVPISYLKKYGNYGDSRFTLKWKDKENGIAESIKPKFAI